MRHDDSADVTNLYVHIFYVMVGIVLLSITAVQFQLFLELKDLVQDADKQSHDAKAIRMDLDTTVKISAGPPLMGVLHNLRNRYRNVSLRTSHSAHSFFDPMDSFKKIV